jgi:hypothetical protein
MTLFQEWRAIVWRELWTWAPWPVWKAAVLPAAAAGSLGVGVALGAEALIPNADSLTLALGFLGIALGVGTWALYDWWRRWQAHQIARVNGDLFVLAQNLTTTVRQPLSIEKFTKGAEKILETRCEPSNREQKLEYLLACTVILNIGAGVWRLPELLAEPLFDPLFPLDRDPLQVWPELRVRLLETQVEDFYRQDFLETLEAFIPGVRRRHLEFLNCVAAPRCAVYKQDLMAAAWHPRRVEAWINQDRWDLLMDE